MQFAKFAIGAAIAAQFYSCSAYAQEPSYNYGPAPIDCQSDQYHLYALSAELPQEVKFLIGDRDEKLRFLGGTVGQMAVPGSKGKLAIHRKSFNLLLEKPKEYWVSGTLELFSQREFCAAVQSGIFLSIAAGSDPIATLKLTSEGSGIRGNSAAFQLTVDRIGRRYYDTFRFFFASSFDWLKVWKKRNPTAPFSSDRNWAKWYSDHSCPTYDSEYDEKRACTYLRNVDALESLLTLIDETGLYRQSKFPDREQFRLSSLPVTVSVGDDCLSLTAKAGGAVVNFCQGYYLQPFHIGADFGVPSK